MKWIASISVYLILSGSAWASCSDILTGNCNSSEECGDRAEAFQACTDAEYNKFRDAITGEGGPGPIYTSPGNLEKLPTGGEGNSDSSSDDSDTEGNVIQ
jgi:hypothetical protein